MDISPAKKALILSFAAAFVLATLWQVVSHREDWPLSPFGMYSKRQGRTVSRTVAVGVSGQGEFSLDGVTRLNTPKHGHLSARAKKKRQSAFLQSILDSNTALKSSPSLRGIRVYKERWTIKKRLRGINKPKRRLQRALYLPPKELTEQLSQQAAGAAPLNANHVPEGDVVVDLGLEHCFAGCELATDGQAAQGSALTLSSDTNDNIPGALGVKVTLPAGKWRVFVRARFKSSNADRIKLAFDAPLTKTKATLGKSYAHLPYDAWTWISTEPGFPPLLFTARKRRSYSFSLASLQGAIGVDQVWFSKTQKELPDYSNPLKQ